jgi:hypothetical protein
MPTKRFLSCAAMSLAATGCAATGSERTEARFPYRIAFETRHAKLNGDDALEITELRGTRPTIELGGEYLLRGRYRLSSHEKGRVVFYETENGGPGTWSTDVDLQYRRITKGEGTFELLHGLPVDGWFHVELEGAKSDGSIVLHNIYFGSGESLYPYDVGAGQGP